MLIEAGLPRSDLRPRPSRTPRQLDHDVGKSPRVSRSGGDVHHRDRVVVRVVEVRSSAKQRNITTSREVNVPCLSSGVRATGDASGDSSSRATHCVERDLLEVVV